MKFYVLASLIIFCVVLSRAIRRNNRMQEKVIQDFWSRENQANNIRKKSLDHLDYIQIPFDQLPTHTLAQNDKVKDCLEVLHTLDNLKIVNLTGLSNTELKLEYGTANLTALSEYDQNFTLLVRTLFQWAEQLYEQKYWEETRQILEFAISIRADIGKCYYMLAEIYQQNGDTQSIQTLIETAKTLRSASRNAIVRKLQESYPCND